MSSSESTTPIRISLSDLIAQAEADIEAARQQEAIHAAEVARWQGDRARAEAWRQRLIALAQPVPPAEED